MQKKHELDESARILSRYMDIVAEKESGSEEARLFYLDNSRDENFVDYVRGFNKLAECLGNAISDIAGKGGIQ